MAKDKTFKVRVTADIEFPATDLLGETWTAAQHNERGPESFPAALQEAFESQMDWLNETPGYKGVVTVGEVTEVK